MFFFKDIALARTDNDDSSMLKREILRQAKVVKKDIDILHIFQLRLHFQAAKIKMLTPMYCPPTMKSTFHFKLSSLSL